MIYGFVLLETYRGNIVTGVKGESENRTVQIFRLKHRMLGSR
jgi:hypothetical protein